MKWALLLGLTLAAAPLAADQDHAELLRSAIEAYEAGLDSAQRDARLVLFRRAERGFQQVASAGGARAALYTNLGNAALQGEHLGAAILAYRRALELDPNHPQARANLDHARSLLPDWVPRPESSLFVDTFFFWHTALSNAERSLFAALLFAAAAFAAAIGIRWRSGLARGFAVVPALGWVALIASLLIERGDQRPGAVVSVPEVTARSADSVHAAPRLGQPLPAGTEVSILEEREGWVRVSLANSRDAWLPSSSVTRVQARDDAGSG